MVLSDFLSLFTLILDRLVHSNLFLILDCAFIALYCIEMFKKL